MVLLVHSVALWQPRLSAARQSSVKLHALIGAAVQQRSQHRLAAGELAERHLRHAVAVLADDLGFPLRVALPQLRVVDPPDLIDRMQCDAWRAHTTHPARAQLHTTHTHDALLMA